MKRKPKLDKRLLKILDSTKNKTSDESLQLFLKLKNTHKLNRYEFLLLLDRRLGIINREAEKLVAQTEAININPHTLDKLLENTAERQSNGFGEAIDLNPFRL